MPFGEASGHFGWFNNQTALEYSYQAVSAAIKFIQNSGFPDHFTLEPLNEPVDNPDIRAFGSTFALSDSGAAWVTKYIKGVLSRVKAVNAKIPVMMQDGFRGEAHYSPSFEARENLAFVRSTSYEQQSLLLTTTYDRTFTTITSPVVLSRRTTGLLTSAPMRRLPKAMGNFRPS